MPTAIGTASELRDLVRVRVGLTGTAILTDAICDQFLAAALAELNRKLPLYELASFTCTADVQAYTYVAANVPSDYLSDPIVFWDGGTGCSTIQLSSRYNDPWIGILQNVFTGRALQKWEVERFVSEYTTLIHYFGGQGGNLIGDERIWLDPKPGSAQTVYHLTAVPRFDAVTDVDVRYQEAFLSYAESRAATFMAGAQSQVMRVQSDAGKDVSNAGGVRYEKQARDAYSRFHRLTSSPAGGAYGGVSAGMGRTRTYQ